MDEAFFVRDGEALRATESTRGPWSRELQHGGPGAALLAGTLARRAAASGLLVVRFTAEFLRPIPIDRFTVRETTLRPGKKLSILAASLWQGETEVIRGNALCLREAPLALPVQVVAQAPTAVERSPEYRFSFFTEPVGYHTAMEARLAAGVFGEGAMAVWMRTRLPIVLGEPLLPIERVVVAADSGNGISVALDLQRWTFLNPDLTVYLHRMPTGEWICLDARTTTQPHGVGLADTALYDEQGALGRSLQSLILQPR